MARTLTTALKNQTTAASLAPVILAFLDFQSGAVRVWSGLGALSWGGNTYVGLGELGSISNIDESTDVRANGISLQMTGIPSSLITTVMGDNYHGRAVKIWLGALDSAGAIIADPYLIFSGRMDKLEIDDGPATAVIRIAAESVLVDLQRSRERRFTHEDQQIDYPLDLGLQFMATAQSTPFMWGGVNMGGTSGGRSGGVGAGNVVGPLIIDDKNH